MDAIFFGHKLSLLNGFFHVPCKALTGSTVLVPCGTGNSEPGVEQMEVQWASFSCNKGPFLGTGADSRISRKGRPDGPT